MAVQNVTWDSETLLEQNRQRLMKELIASLREYENRFELGSERLDDELAAGRIRETAEICDWVIAFHSYQALVREHPEA